MQRKNQSSAMYHFCKKKTQEESAKTIIFDLFDQLAGFLEFFINNADFSPKLFWYRGDKMSLTQLEMVKRGTLFRWTLKLKEVLNKQILSASVPEAAVLI